jgi:hypothetical protein
VSGLAFLPLKSDLKGTVKNVTVMKKNLQIKRTLGVETEFLIWWED